MNEVFVALYTDNEKESGTVWTGIKIFTFTA